MKSPFQSVMIHMSESDLEDEVNYADGAVLHISRNTHQTSCPSGDSATSTAPAPAPAPAPNPLSSACSRPAFPSLDAGACLTSPTVLTNDLTTAAAPSPPRYRASVTHTRSSMVSATMRLCPTRHGAGRAECLSILPNLPPLPTAGLCVPPTDANHPAVGNFLSTHVPNVNADETATAAPTMMMWMQTAGSPNQVEGTSCDRVNIPLIRVGKPPARLSRRARAIAQCGSSVCAPPHSVDATTECTAATQMSPTRLTGPTITFASVAAPSAASTVRFTIINESISAVSRPTCAGAGASAAASIQIAAAAAAAPTNNTALSTSVDCASSAPRRGCHGDADWQQQRFDLYDVCQSLRRDLCARNECAEAVRARREVQRALQPIVLTPRPAAALHGQGEEGSATRGAPPLNNTSCQGTRSAARHVLPAQTGMCKGVQQEDNEAVCCSCVSFSPDPLDELDTCVSELLRNRERWRAAAHALYRLRPLPFYMSHAHEERAVAGGMHAERSCAELRARRCEPSTPCSVLSLGCTLTVSTAARLTLDGAPGAWGGSATESVSVRKGECAAVPQPSLNSCCARKEAPSWPLSSPGERRVLQVCGYTHECHTTTTTANNNNNGSPHTTTTYTTTNNVDHNSRIGGAHVHRDNNDEMCACATAEEARSDEFAYEAVFFLPSTQSVGVPGACASSVPVARLPLTPRLLEDPAQVTFYRRYLVRTQSRVATMANNAEDYATFTNHLDGYDSVPLSSAHAAHTDMTNTHSTHACHTSDSDATTCGDSASATASSCGYLTMTLAHVSTTAKYAVDLTLLLLPYRRTHTSSSSAAALSASAAYYRVPFHPERTPRDRALHKVTLTFDSHTDFLAGYRTLLYAATRALVQVESVPDGCTAHSGVWTLRATHSPWRRWTWDMCGSSPRSAPVAAFVTRAADYARRAVQAAEGRAAAAAADDDDDASKGAAAGLQRPTSNSIGCKEEVYSHGSHNMCAEITREKEAMRRGCLWAAGPCPEAVVAYGTLAHVSRMVCAGENQGGGNVYDVRVMPRWVWALWSTQEEEEEEDVQQRRARAPVLVRNAPVISTPQEAVAIQGRSSCCDQGNTHNDSTHEGGMIGADAREERHTTTRTGEAAATAAECVTPDDGCMREEDATLLQHCSRLSFQQRLYGVWSDEQAYYALYEPWLSAQRASQRCAASVMSLAEFIHLFLYPCSREGEVAWMRETATQEARLQLAHVLMTQLTLMVVSLHGKGVLLGPCSPHRLWVHIPHAAAQTRGPAVNDGLCPTPEACPMTRCGVKAEEEAKNVYHVPTAAASLMETDCPAASSAVNAVHTNAHANVNANTNALPASGCLLPAPQDTSQSSNTACHSSAVQLLCPLLGFSGEGWSYERQQSAWTAYLPPRHVLLEAATSRETAWTTRDDWWTVLCIFFELFCPTGEKLVPTRRCASTSHSPIFADGGGAVGADPPESLAAFAAASCSLSSARRAHASADSPSRLCCPSSPCMCVWGDVLCRSSSASSPSSASAPHDATLRARVSQFVRRRVLAVISSVLDNWIVTKAEEMALGTGAANEQANEADSLSDMPWLMHYRAVVDVLLEAVFPSSSSPSSSRCDVHQPAREMLELPFFATVDWAQVWDGCQPLSPTASRFVRDRLSEPHVREVLRAHRCLDVDGNNHSSTITAAHDGLCAESHIWDSRLTSSRAKTCELSSSSGIHSNAIHISALHARGERRGGSGCRPMSSSAALSAMHRGCVGYGLLLDDVCPSRSCLSSRSPRQVGGASPSGRLSPWEVMLQAGAEADAWLSMWYREDERDELRETLRAVVWAQQRRSDATTRVCATEEGSTHDDEEQENDSLSKMDNNTNSNNEQNEHMCDDDVTHNNANMSASPSNRVHPHETSHTNNSACIRKQADSCHNDVNSVHNNNTLSTSSLIHDAHTSYPGSSHRHTSYHSHSNPAAHIQPNDNTMHDHCNDGQTTAPEERSAAGCTRRQNRLRTASTCTQVGHDMNGGDAGKGASESRDRLVHKENATNTVNATSVARRPSHVHMRAGAGGGSSSSSSSGDGGRINSNSLNSRRRRCALPRVTADYGRTSKDANRTGGDDEGEGRCNDGGDGGGATSGLVFSCSPQRERPREWGRCSAVSQLHDPLRRHGS